MVDERVVISAVFGVSCSGLNVKCAILRLDKTFKLSVNDRTVADRMTLTCAQKKTVEN